MEQKWIYPLASKVIAEKINQLAKETGLSKEECTIFIIEIFVQKKKL